MWILFPSLAVIVAGTYVGFDLRKWFRSAPLTKRFFLDEVWNALVAAGAIPGSDGPTRRDRLLP